MLSSYRNCRDICNRRREKLANTNSCDTCAYCGYDEDYGEYVCDIDMDEDEYIRFLSDHHSQCPYYRNGDEYLVVRSQM